MAHLKNNDKLVAPIKSIGWDGGRGAKTKINVTNH